jgi:hypothetical protein
MICIFQVLGLLWNLAHSEDVPTDIMDQALSAHIKILDYSCSQVVNFIVISNSIYTFELSIYTFELSIYTFG